MAKNNNPDLVLALRQTAARLKAGARYEWGHMGRCNCGHLIQTVTRMSDVEIIHAVDHQLDEWTEHARDYCASTGHAVDDIFVTLESIGFSHQDVANLERLADERVLKRLPGGHRHLRRNDREDVALYMDTMADLLASG